MRRRRYAAYAAAMIRGPVAAALAAIVCCLVTGCGHREATSTSNEGDYCIYSTVGGRGPYYPNRGADITTTPGPCGFDRSLAGPVPSPRAAVVEVKGYVRRHRPDRTIVGLSCGRRPDNITCRVRFAGECNVLSVYGTSSQPYVLPGVGSCPPLRRKT